MLVWQNATLVINGWRVEAGIMPNGVHGWGVYRRDGMFSHWHFYYADAVKWVQQH